MTSRWLYMKLQLILVCGFCEWTKTMGLFRCTNNSLHHFLCNFLSALSLTYLYIHGHAKLCNIEKSSNQFVALYFFFLSSLRLFVGVYSEYGNIIMVLRIIEKTPWFELKMVRQKERGNRREGWNKLLVSL